MQYVEAHGLESVRKIDFRWRLVIGDARNFWNGINVTSVICDFAPSHTHVAVVEIIQERGSKSMIPVKSNVPRADFSAIGEELGIVADLCRQVRAVREDGVVVMNRCRKVIFGPQIFIDANIPTLPVVRARPADVRFGQWGHEIVQRPREGGSGEIFEPLLGKGVLQAIVRGANHVWRLSVTAHKLVAKKRQVRWSHGEVGVKTGIRSRSFWIVHRN